MQSASSPSTSSYPVRVLHCIPTLGTGGAEIQLKLLAPRLAARGISVAVLGRMDRSDADRLEALGVRCFPLQGRGSYDPTIVLSILRAIQAFRPTVVQTWLTQMDIVAGTIAIVAGLPWVLSERSSPPAYPPSVKNWLRRLLGRRAFVVANAAQGLDVWSGHSRTELIPNAIDVAAMSVVTAGSGPSDWPFPDRPTLVSVSRLVAEKSVDVLIDAVAIARGSIPDLALVVIGDGPERPRLEARVVEKDLIDRVAFVGFQPEPAAWVRSATLYASASRFEGHPNAVTEAAAVGVPCVLSDIAVHRTLLGAAGTYAPPDDAAAFAERIVALVRDPAQRTMCSTAGRSAIARFEIGGIVDAYAALYDRLSRSGGVGRFDDRPSIPQKRR